MNNSQLERLAFNKYIDFEERVQQLYFYDVMMLDRKFKKSYAKYFLYKYRIRQRLFYFFKYKKLNKFHVFPSFEVRRWARKDSIYKHWWTSIFLYFPFYTTFKIVNYYCGRHLFSAVDIELNKGFNRRVRVKDIRETVVFIRNTAISSVGKKQKVMIKMERNNLRYLHYLKRRHHQITRYVQHLINLTKYNHLLKYLSLKLEFVVLQLGFATVIKEARNMIINGYIYINGVASRDPQVILKLGDRVQMVIDNQDNSWYYFHLIKRQQIMGLYKKRDRNISILDKLALVHKFPWEQGHFLTNFNISFFLSNFLEVDYEALTGIVLMWPCRLIDYPINYLIQYPFNYLALYNWKYYF